MPIDMRARIGQVELPNLVLTAAGCAGAGRELAQFTDVARVGAIISKSIPGAGHRRVPPARPALAAVARCPGGGLDRGPDHP